MYAAVRRYRIDPELSSEVIKQIIEEFVPLIEELAGITAYFVVEGRDGAFVTVTICDDEAVVQETSKRATEWIKAYLSDSIFDREEIGRFLLEVEEPLDGPLHEGITAALVAGTEDPKGLRRKRLAQEEGEERASGEAAQQGQQSPERPLSVAEVREALGMGRAWVYRSLRSGEIPSIKLGGSVKVKLSDLQAYLDEHRRDRQGRHEE